MTAACLNLSRLLNFQLSWDMETSAVDQVVGSFIAPTKKKGWLIGGFLGLGGNRHHTTL